MIGWPLLIATAVVAAVVCVALIVALMPVLRRIALAKPNARSSHHIPTPQGGGAAVIAATLIATFGAGTLTPLCGSGTCGALAVILIATLALALLGALDDVFVLPVAPRLITQALAAGAVLIALPGDLRLITGLPLVVERALLLVPMLWMINLTNFMDGIDWITIAEFVPLTATLALLGLAFGALSPAAIVVAVALGAALVGFAPFNRPVARLFLGDVGSLPIGLLASWLLLELAGRGFWAAALLLPLYYLADATLTLLRRALAGEPFWESHRSHFYQRATTYGWRVGAIVGHVFAVNLLLGALALASARWATPLAGALCLALGAALVAWLLWRLSRTPQPA